VPVAQRDRPRRRHGRVMRILRGMPVVLGAVVLATAVGCAPATPPATPSPTGSAATGVSTPDPAPPSSAPTLSPGGAAGGGLVVGGGGFPMPPPGACHAGTLSGQPLPDTACTPGEISAVVTQASIGSTICKSGWTATVRPPVAVTDAIKTKSAQAYGLSSSERGELDHDIPLELGGYPGTAADVGNLWFETGPIPNPKDQIENTLNHARVPGSFRSWWPRPPSPANGSQPWPTPALRLWGTGCACELTRHGALGDERDHHCGVAGRGRGGHVRNRSDAAVRQGPQPGLHLPKGPAQVSGAVTWTRPRL